MTCSSPSGAASLLSKVTIEVVAEAEIEWQYSIQILPYEQIDFRDPAAGNEDEVPGQDLEIILRLALQKLSNIDNTDEQVVVGRAASQQ